MVDGVLVAATESPADSHKGPARGRPAVNAEYCYTIRCLGNPDVVICSDLMI